MISSRSRESQRIQILESFLQNLLIIAMQFLVTHLVTKPMTYANRNFCAISPLLLRLDQIYLFLPNGMQDKIKLS